MNGDFGGTVRGYGARTSYHSLTATRERAFPASNPMHATSEGPVPPPVRQRAAAADLLTCLVVWNCSRIILLSFSVAMAFKALVLCSLVLSMRLQLHWSFQAIKSWDRKLINSELCSCWMQTVTTLQKLQQEFWIVNIVRGRLLMCRRSMIRSVAAWFWRWFLCDKDFAVSRL